MRLVLVYFPKKWTAFILSMNRPLLHGNELGGIDDQGLPVFWRLRLLLLRLQGQERWTWWKRRVSWRPSCSSFQTYAENRKCSFSRDPQARADHWTVYLFLSPQGSFMLFYHARIELLKGNVEEVISLGGIIWEVVCVVELHHILIQHKSV